MHYVKAFIIAGPIMALLAHFMTSEPMPWWPDTLIFGGFMGAFAAFLLMRFVFARRAVGHLRGAGRVIQGKDQSRSR
jgi:hypothetical protein